MVSKFQVVTAFWNPFVARHVILCKKEKTCSLFTVHRRTRAGYFGFITAYDTWHCVYSGNLSNTIMWLIFFKSLTNSMELSPWEVTSYSTHNILRNLKDPYWLPLWFSGRVPSYRSRGPGFDFRHYQIFWEVVGLEEGTTEELLRRKSSSSGLENREYGHRDPLCWPCSTLYLQTLAPTSPTRGGRWVGIVHSQTKAMEFVFVWRYLTCSQEPHTGSYEPDRCIPPHPVSIISSHLRLGLCSGLFPSDFFTKNQNEFLCFLMRASCPGNLTLLDGNFNYIWQRVHIMKCFISFVLPFHLALV
jgi:hypothetical protein